VQQTDNSTERESHFKETEPMRIHHCPLKTGITRTPEFEKKGLATHAVNDCRVKEIFVEPVKPRGPGLRLCQEALAQDGYRAEAEAVGWIRNEANWSSYVAELIANVQRAMRRHSDISMLRLLLYPSGLRPEDRAKIKQDDAGVVWLRKRVRTLGAIPDTVGHASRWVEDH